MMFENKTARQIRRVFAVARFRHHSVKRHHAQTGMESLRHDAESIAVIGFQRTAETVQQIQHRCGVSGMKSIP